MEVRVVTLTEHELAELIEQATVRGFTRAAEEREEQMAALARDLDRPHNKASLTVAEAADYAGRHPGTVRRWISEGLPASSQDGVAGQRIDRDDLERWLRGGYPSSRRSSLASKSSASNEAR